LLPAMGAQDEMSSGLLDAITHGIGVAISPLVIIVIVLMLLSPRAVSNGLAFLAGWVAGLIVLGVIIFAVGGYGGAGSRHAYEGAIKIFFGLLLLAFAFHLWLRSRDPKNSGGSNWMSTVDTYGVLKSAGTGFFFAAIYPKNLIITAAAASEIAKSSSTGQEIGEYVLFVVLGSVTVAGPILLYMVVGKRIDPQLTRLKAWLTTDSQMILIALMLVFGLKLSIQGIYMLAAG
jgi:hypothetical protein